MLPLFLLLFLGGYLIEKARASTDLALDASALLSLCG